MKKKSKEYYGIDYFTLETEGGFTTQEEMEANYFASVLLMPKEKFLEVLNQTTDTKLIADYFGVSEEQVMNRIRWLNYDFKD